MNAKTAIKKAIDEATDQELIAVFGAISHPDEKAIGAYFSKLAADLAKRIENYVGINNK